jgi:hypothetical protein
MDEDFGDNEPMGYGKDEGRGVGSKPDGETAGQKSAEIGETERKATPLLNPPIPHPPLAPDYYHCACGAELKDFDEICDECYKKSPEWLARNSMPNSINT